MTVSKLWTLCALLALLVLPVACGSPSDGGAGTAPVASPVPDVGQATTSPVPATRQAEARGTCGDGVCDGAEQANPDLCPQDCSGGEAGEGKCGDGICDEKEQADPSLCPQDCAAGTVEEGTGAGAGEPGAGEPEEGGPQPGEPGGDEPEGDQPGGDGPDEDGPSIAGQTWKAEVVWGCDSESVTGTDTWTADLEYEFTVGADGTLSGTGSGAFRRVGCTRVDCACWIEPGAISLQVSGLQQGEYFYINLVPEYDLTYCMTCAGITHCAGGIRQLEWCNCSAVGGPLEVNIEIADLADRVFECNPRTDGATGLISVWAEGWTIIERVQD
jgi:hypothetical protein